MPQIAPSSLNSRSFILHPTPIDIGKGPILFYWYDVNAYTGTMQVNGRLITDDGESTVDFPISNVFCTLSTPMWFGDYHTGGGFYRRANPQEKGSRDAYEYFPVWKQSGGKIYYARVTYTPPSRSKKGHEELKVNWRRSVPIDLANVTEIEAVREEEDRHREEQ